MTHAAAEGERNCAPFLVTSHVTCTTRQHRGNPSTLGTSKHVAPTAAMARGGKVSRSHGRIQRSEKDGASDDDSSDEEAQAPGAARAKLGGQPATAGMMPPSDSDEDEYEEEEEEKPKAKPKPAGKSGQPATAGKLPPTSDSDEEDEDEEEDDDDEDDDEDDKAQPAVARCVVSTPWPCLGLTLTPRFTPAAAAPLHPSGPRRRSRKTSPGWSSSESSGALPLTCPLQSRH